VIETTLAQRPNEPRTATEIGCEQAAIAARAQLEKGLTAKLFEQAKAGPLGEPFVPAAAFKEAVAAIQSGKHLQGAYAAAERLLLTDATTPQEQAAVLSMIRQQAKLGHSFDEAVIRKGLATLRADHADLLVPKKSPGDERVRQRALETAVSELKLRGEPAAPRRIERDFSADLKTKMGTTDAPERRLPEPHATNAAALFGSLQPDAPRDGSPPYPVRLSRAGIEALFTPPLEGYSAEVVTFACPTGELLTVEVLIRGPAPDHEVVGRVRRDAHAVDDGKGGKRLEWKNDIFTVEESHQGLKLGDEIYAQQDAFFKIYAPKQDTELRLVANISVGVYAWARQGFAFATDSETVESRMTYVREEEKGAVSALAKRYPQLFPDGAGKLFDPKCAQRNLMLMEVYSWAETMRAQHPEVFTDARMTELRAQLKLCNDPADFTELRLRDGPNGKEVRMTLVGSEDAAKAENARLDQLIGQGKLMPEDRPAVLVDARADRPGLRLDDKRFGAASILVAATAWNGVRKPNEPAEGADARVSKPRLPVRPMVRPGP
jgi:hypothetical protein